MIILILLSFSFILAIDTIRSNYYYDNDIFIYKVHDRNKVLSYFIYTE